MFGSKQRGSKAIHIGNIFLPYFYDTYVDLDKIKSYPWPKEVINVNVIKKV